VTEVFFPDSELRDSGSLVSPVRDSPMCPTALPIRKNVIMSAIPGNRFPKLYERVPLKA
jgi:hypothetical protein